MNNRLLNSQKIERHLKLWIYLLPVVGVIPAVWTLYRPQPNNESNLAEHRSEKKASRLSLNLVLIWLISYTSLSLGASNTTGIVAFRLLYANTILTTAYFVACIFLMSRLSHKSLSSTDKIDRVL
ncbi:hypothetical protein I4641_02970 [Waterburya agarophytonicola K14]|uniref:Uncharacterized protein n=1 Tax=Waterburya agarophytonicola KI4 TaxID=2874699 RepID=A0A964BNH2_9CYAN|nr:hypothetical protein [Waterburya agarophytonicola]MCC0175942.1 hypothetical protein [Waterburya agarophytonicola KI4]